MLRLFVFLIFSFTANSTPALTVEDFAGRQVSLDKPASRIVALAPHIVENIFSAGAGQHLVGVVDYSNFPETARQIPRVGSYNAFSLEKIASLNPDLVVMWGSGNGMQTLSQLERLGVAVYVSELRGLSDVPKSIRLLGLLAGTSVASEAEATRIEKQIAHLRREFSTEEPVSVFYQIWNDPLQTINGEHLISEIIAMCGGKNIFSDARSLAPRVSLESVLVRDPDVIVASGMDKSRPEWLDAWRQYPAMTSVRKDALYFIEPDHIQRPTARILLGASKLCSQLHQPPS